MYVRRTDTGEILQVREMMQHETAVGLLRTTRRQPAEDVEKRLRAADGEETGELVLGAGEVETRADGGSH